METTQQDTRLESVMARDRTADGVFVYGVRSTGIFCKPSCAARRPGLGQIALFENALQARQAGFRACLRCRPESEAAAAPRVDAICRYIDSQSDPPPLTALARRFGLSADHLARSFKSATGMTPKEYASLGRVERLRTQLRAGKTVTSALYDAGFGSSSRLYERSSALLGMTPNAYRRKGQGSHIGYTIVASPLGRLLVAASACGICSVKLGDADGPLERLLFAEYSAADVRRDDRTLAPLVRRLLDNIDSGASLGDLPLDLRGTAFMRKVWKVLAAIPRGTTRTYAQVASAIGHPRAARAVGRACASNQLALVVPCHRVVPAAGGSGSYRWGAKRKQWLLERESRKAAPPRPARN